jgi:hypothetical protein
MNLLIMIRNELWAVFVDDGIFAGAIVVWLVAGTCLLPRPAPCAEDQDRREAGEQQ